MTNFKLRKLANLLIFSFFMLSCSNELHMNLPNGPVGPSGLSAYEVWVKEVNDGTIVWDKNNTDINNFFLYLKGADGKDGQNGVDGKSAYQLWVEQVKTGLDNPHNTGTNWSVDNVSMQDFWYFLTGAKGQNGSTPIIGTNGNWFIDGDDTGIPAKGKDGSDGQNGQDGSVVTIGSNGNWFIDGIDSKVLAFGQDGQDGSNGQDGVNGKSAYELWIQQVKIGLEDPHNPGKIWDKTKITTKDFWEYLKGADGKDGADGETGKPGQDIVIIKGKANVISQYSAQEFNEFVRWTDGGVAFIVYNDQGEVSPGAKVRGLPGILDPTKVYTAGVDGVFIVLKEDLPLDKPITDRFGASSQVEYLKSTGVVVKEVSASNTYVPARMQIRFRLTQNISIDSSDENIYYVIERKTDIDKDWESIPSYLGNLAQYIIAYELNDINDPTSYDNTSKKFYNALITISSGTYAFVKRLVKKSDYVLNDTYLWDNKDHYFNMVLESYYGEKPHANAVIKMAPIQYMPILTNVKGYNYSSSLNVFSKITGVFDFGTNNSYIDKDLIFKNILRSQQKIVGNNSFDYYYTEKAKIEDYANSKSFSISFTINGNVANNSKELSSVNLPSFTVLTPYINSSIYISSSSFQFKTLGNIGNLLSDSGSVNFKIVGTKNSSYNYPDIPVQQVTE